MWLNALEGILPPAAHDPEHLGEAPCTKNCIDSNTSGVVEEGIVGDTILQVSL